MKQPLIVQVPKVVWLIFFLGLLVRFLYFPDNVYFAYDQARDAYMALEILKGDLKLIGPPSFASDKLFPGPLIFYIYAPIYFFFGKNPEAVAAFLRIYNAFGVFFVFFIGSIIFNRFTGLIAALLFAFSYEQSQYSLYLLHQPLAVITVLLFYLGLSLLIFKRDHRGVVISAAALGLSMQAHYGYIFLGAVLLTMFIVFQDRLKLIRFKDLLLSFSLLILTTSSFLLVELKYHYFSSFIRQSFDPGAPKVSSGIHFNETLFIINRFLYDTFLANYQLTPLVALLLAAIILYFLHQKELKLKILFLLIWFFGGLSLYLLSGVSSYYYSASTSVSLLILTSYAIYKLYSSSHLLLAIFIILGIIANNLFSITTINPQGLNRDMVIQPGMLTSSQRQILDYVYTNAEGQPFAIRSLTVPLDINTTWSYLFEWYGKNKYGYLPTWIGPIAQGFPGNLPVENARSKLPQKQFLIIEPTIGIREAIKDNFFREESYFTKLSETRSFGTITVQKRQKY